ncbi:MAG: hypothetical protein QNJ14_04265 [Woeseiaceae bacterium]|nr:hypothetical protein [Woeseiaceae bacterium]
MSKPIGRPRVPHSGGKPASYWRKQLKRNERAQETIRLNHGAQDYRLKSMAITADKYRAHLREIEAIEKRWSTEDAAPGQRPRSKKKLPAHCHMTVYGVGCELAGEIYIQTPAMPAADDPLHSLARNHQDEWLTPARNGLGYIYSGPLIEEEHHE